MIAVAEVCPLRETQRNATAKTKATEHKKFVLSILNHAAQTYAAELNARWRSLTNIYDTLILVRMHARFRSALLLTRCFADRALAALGRSHRHGAAAASNFAGGGGSQGRRELQSAACCRTSVPP
jgi:hypothetical protein